MKTSTVCEVIRGAAGGPFQSPLPGCGGRADRCAAPPAWSRSALLEEPRASGGKRSMTRTSAGTTAARATRQRNERKRKRGLHRGTGEACEPRRFSASDALGGSAGARLRAAGTDPARAAAARGHAD